MQKRLIITLVLTIASFISCLATFSVWMGVLFGEQLNENKYEYISNIKTNCSYSLLNYKSELCCDQRCDTRSCNRDCYEYESCSLIPQNVTTNGSIPCCNHKYHCCRECCETCQKCYYIGKMNICSSYKCNCKCCSSMDSYKCEISCGTCYEMKYSVSYTTLEGEFISVKRDVSCQNADCFNSTLKKYQLPQECYYDPNNHYYFSLSQYYETRIIPKEPYKVGIMYLFVGLSCLFFIMFIGGVFVIVYVGFSRSRSRVVYAEIIDKTHIRETKELESNESTE